MKSFHAMGKGQSKSPKLASQKGWLTFGVAVLTALLVVVGPMLQDRLHLLLYPPAPEVERLAQDTTMTPLARRIFYRQAPTIEPRQVFIEQCGEHATEDRVILGCYHAPLGRQTAAGKIVIKSIEDSQFSGTMEVTAAHEMLHAVYEQLDEAEKNELFEQLKLAQQQVTNKRLLSILTDYEAAGDVDRYRHELYAHLGTELKTFNNPKLEAHYQRYFRDRQRVVALSEKAVRVVTAFDQQAEALQAEIERLEAKLKKSRDVLDDTADRLTQQSSELALQETELVSTRNAAEAALQNDDFRADQLIDQFQRGKFAFNSDVKDYNREVQQYRGSLERYNQRLEGYRQEVDRYNQMAEETRQALKSLEGTVELEEVSLP